MVTQVLPPGVLTALCRFTRLGPFTNAVCALYDAHSKFAEKTKQIAFGGDATYAALAPLILDIAQTLVDLHGDYHCNMPCITRDAAELRRKNRNFAKVFHGGS